MFLLTEPFVSAEVAYRRERAAAGLPHTSTATRTTKGSARTDRARSFAHRLATGH